MPSSIQRMRILLSSPNNLRTDRDAVREVAHQINSDSGRRDGFYVEIVSWETHTRPAVGAHPQEIINEQFPDDIDIYLGLLGTYFGTPTRKYQSGTEEEFRLAYAAWQESASPEILFYFSSVKASPDEINADQLKLCEAFRKEIGELGVKYEKYDDLAQFKVSLHRHLTETVYEVLRKKTARDESFEPQFEYREFLPNYERLVLEKPEIAVSDLFEEATSFLASHNKEMESLTDDLKRTSFKMNKQTKSLVNANSQGHDKQVARLIQEILDTLIDYRNKLKMRLPIMSSSMEKALVLSQRAINLIKLNDLHAQFDLNFLVGPMSGMKSALSDLKPTVEAASLSFNDWPEIGGDFDGNKDRVLALHKDFCGFVDRSVALMTDIEEEIVNGS